MSTNVSTNVSAENVFLVMGLKEEEVLFAIVVANNNDEASKLFTKKNPEHELMTISALSEMQQAVKLLTYVQEGKDLQDENFPMSVYRGEVEVDVGKFGL